MHLAFHTMSEGVAFNKSNRNTYTKDLYNYDYVSNYPGGAKGRFITFMKILLIFVKL